MKLLQVNLNIIRWFSRDFVYKYLIPLVGYFSYLTYLLLKFVRPKLAFKFLLMSSRFSHSKFAMRSISNNLSNMYGYIDESLTPDLDIKLRTATGRSIILRNPDFSGGEIDKGVLFITFTTVFPYYFNNINIHQLLKYFYIVLEPSWAGYALPEILFWSKFNNGPIIVESTEPKDFELIQGLNSSLVAVSFGASDWVDHRRFTPLGLNKEYESIYVANFNAVKRHHVYFRALNKLKNTGYKKSALVCGKWGEQIDEVYDLIKYYGLDDCLDVFVGLNQTELNVLLNKSKVNLLMSLKEGSNRSIFEGFYSGVPAIILKKNIGVNKNYINENTGVMIKEWELASTLLHFSKYWQKYDARKWALENISAIKTTEKLTKILSENSRYFNTKSPIAIKVNIPEVEFLNINEKPYYLNISDIIELFSNKSENSDYFKAEIEKLLNILPER